MEGLTISVSPTKWSRPPIQENGTIHVPSGLFIGQVA
nr:MAG TPA: hypothetical protein [Caudoviricetes sp.]